MNGQVFPVQANANSFAAAIDTDIGYPLAGVRCGQGAHATIAEGTTVRWRPVIRHPSIAQWAVVEDPLVLSIETRRPPTGGTRTVLDSTWGL